jgi:hypothetical protein
MFMKKGMNKKDLAAFMKEKLKKTKINEAEQIKDTGKKTTSYFMVGQSQG